MPLNYEELKLLKESEVIKPFDHEKLKPYKIDTIEQLKESEIELLERLTLRRKDCNILSKNLKSYIENKENYKTLDKDSKILINQKIMNINKIYRDKRTVIEDKLRHIKRLLKSVERINNLDSNDYQKALYDSSNQKLRTMSNKEFIYTKINIENLDLMEDFKKEFCKNHKINDFEDYPDFE